jgi:hypothetical protein
MKRAGHDGGIEPVAFERLATRRIGVDRGVLRRPALADNRRPTRSAATPASNALPPRVSTSSAAALVRGWPAETAAWGPITGGRSAAPAALTKGAGVATVKSAAAAAAMSEAR